MTLGTGGTRMTGGPRAGLYFQELIDNYALLPCLSDADICDDGLSK